MPVHILTLSPGYGGEVQRIGHRIPAMLILGLHVQLVGSGRLQFRERNLLSVQHHATGAASRGGHLDLPPALGRHHQSAAVRLTGRYDGDEDYDDDDEGMMILGLRVTPGQVVTLMPGDET